MSNQQRQSLRNKITTKIAALEATEKAQSQSLESTRTRLDCLRELRTQLVNDETMLQTVERTFNLLSEFGIE